MKSTANIYAAHALRWAIEQLDAQDYTAMCYAFCEDAYELGGQIILDGQGTSAKEAADFYLARANCDPAALAPPGSYVFYDCSGEINGERRNWGHMGLSLGDGRIVHAWGTVRIDALHAVERLSAPPGWTQPRYSGWCPPELILVGMHEQEG